MLLPDGRLTNRRHKRQLLLTMTKAGVDRCLAWNGEGLAYREFSCVHEELEPFYFE